MLFQMEGRAQRVQGAFIEVDEARAVMNYIRANNDAYFDPEIEDLILNGPPPESAGIGFGDNDEARVNKASTDPYFVPILKWVVRDDNITRTVSISNVQRQFGLGFSRAGKIIDALCAAGYIGDNKGSKSRDVIATREQVESIYGE